jgi:putative hemin transport protein
MCSQVNDIRQSFASLRLDKKLRHREIAHFLQITEAELVDAHVGVSKLASIKASPHLARAIRLKKPWHEILGALEGLGEVLALTRNEFAVHEKVGVYNQVSLQGDVGLVHGDLDLRLFYRHWEFAYIFEEGKGNSLQRSIQFFDESGMAVHKIFLSTDSNHFYLDELAEMFADSNQDSGILVQDKSQVLPRSQFELPADFSLDNFRNDWSELQDTHEFFDLLKNYQLTRLQAIQQIGRHYAEPLTGASLKAVFSDAQQFEVPVMIFVGNRGVIQIHTGLIHKVLEAKAWFNILDPGFNLHLDLEKIDHIWLVRKPSQDGVITSMELLDQYGEMIALVFGERKPGDPELASWRSLLEGVLEDQVNQELSMAD